MDKSFKRNILSITTPPSVDMDKLHENYQLLTSSDIPTSVKEKSSLDEDDHYPIDDLNYSYAFVSLQ